MPTAYAKLPKLLPPPDAGSRVTGNITCKIPRDSQVHRVPWLAFSLPCTTSCQALTSGHRLHGIPVSCVGSCSGWQGYADRALERLRRGIGPEDISLVNSMMPTEVPGLLGDEASKLYK